MGGGPQFIDDQAFHGSSSSSSSNAHSAGSLIFARSVEDRCPEPSQQRLPVTAASGPVGSRRRDKTEGSQQVWRRALVNHCLSGDTYPNHHLALSSRRHAEPVRSPQSANCHPCPAPTLQQWGADVRSAALADCLASLETQD